MTEEPTNLLALREAKRRARDLFAHRYSEGFIDGDELERRLEALEDAETLTLLDDLVADIVEPGVAARAFLVSTRAAPTALVDPRDVHPRRELVTAFSSTTRSGPWIPARHTKMIAVFGELILDFRGARLGPGVTTVELRVSCSSVRLIVPPGLSVSMDVSVILGSMKRDSGVAELPAHDDEPSLLVIGRTLLASLELGLG